MYIFIFDEYCGCRSINRDFHGLLPPCAGPTMSDEDLLKLKSSINVANSYFFTIKDNAPTIEYRDDGSYIMIYKKSSGLRSKVGENSRCVDFKATVQVKYKNIELESIDQCLPDLNGHICMFSGGGDHVVLAMEDTSESNLYDLIGTEETVPSPLTEGELRTGEEMKYKTTQSNEDIESQLKANMLLFTARCTVRRIERLHNKPNPVSTLKKLNKISTYGLTFGLNKPVMILKLTLDFTTSEIYFEKRYQSPDELPPEPRVDCAMKYLIERIFLSY